MVSGHGWHRAAQYAVDGIQDADRREDEAAAVRYEPILRIIETGPSDLSK